MLPNLAIVAGSQASAIALLSQQSDCHLRSSARSVPSRVKQRLEIARLRIARPAPMPPREI